jgi:Sodium/hydrogen exchanger family
LRRRASVPLRLLGIGLPLTIALGALVAAVIFGELTFWEAVIVGVVLAPTDAALGQAVVTEPRVPTRIRQGLNVESGLNDGICVPLLFTALAAADVQWGIFGGRTWDHPFIRGGRLRDRRRGGRRPGGRSRGRLARVAIDHRPEDHGEMNRLTDEVGGLLSGVTFVVFGAILLGPALGELSWQLALYAVLSLTVVRMVPVAIAMLDSHVRLPTLGFLAWFGPRGLASNRLRGDRHRGLPASSRARDRPRGLSHRGALGLRPWPHRRSLGRSLRGLVRAPPPKTAADVETPGRGDAPSTSGKQCCRSGLRRFSPKALLGKPCGFEGLLARLEQTEADDLRVLEVPEGEEVALASDPQERLCSEKPTSTLMVGSATLTMVASRTTMNCATAMSASTAFASTP